MPKSIFILVLSISLYLLLLNGCSPKLTGNLNKNEYQVLDKASRKAMIREYPEIDRDVILEAAKKTLRSSNRDYKIIAYKNSGFFAVRQWQDKNAVDSAGAELWYVRVVTTKGVSKVMATAWTQSLSAGSEVPFISDPETNNNKPLFTDPVMTKNKQYFLSPPLYKLFFDRLEYLLGLKKRWPSCPGSYKGKFGEDLIDSLTALCRDVKATIPDQ